MLLCEICNTYTGGFNIRRVCVCVCVSVCVCLSHLMSALISLPAEGSESIFNAA